MDYRPKAKDLEGFRKTVSLTLYIVTWISVGLTLLLIQKRFAPLFPVEFPKQIGLVIGFSLVVTSFSSNEDRKKFVDDRSQFSFLKILKIFVRVVSSIGGLTMVYWSLR